jgi:hypothetical protein
MQARALEAGLSVPSQRGGGRRCQTENFVVTLSQFIESSNPNAPTIRAMLDDAAGNFSPAPGEAPAGPGAHGARSATPDAHGSSSLGQQGYAQQVNFALA